MHSKELISNCNYWYSTSYKSVYPNIMAYGKTNSKKMFTEPHSSLYYTSTYSLTWSLLSSSRRKGKTEDGGGESAAINCDQTLLESGQLNYQGNRGKHFFSLVERERSILKFPIKVSSSPPPTTTTIVFVSPAIINTDGDEN